MRAQSEVMRMSRPETWTQQAAAYRGDIYALERDSTELAGLGVEVGPFSRKHRCFTNCVVRHDALMRLQVLGCKYLWDLMPVGGTSTTRACLLN